MPSKISLVINRDASRAKLNLNVLKHDNNSYLIPPKKQFIVSGKQLGKTINKLKIDHPELLIIGGGDGTISTAAGLMANTGIKMGIIPLGTSNVIARGLHLPLQPEESIQVALHGQDTWINAGKINNQIFLNEVTIGLPAITTTQTPPFSKTLLGRGAYFLKAATAAWQHTPFKCEVSTPTKKISLSTHHLIILNGSLHAGRNLEEITSLTKPALAVIAIGNKPGHLQYAAAFANYRFHPRLYDTRLPILKAAHTNIKVFSPQPSQADGEEIPAKAFKAELLIKALQIRTPDKET